MMSALAVFSCRPNSHPFQERHVSLHEAVKIGRAVARARPASNNAIFDCKVLSRNHALLWYDSGKFYLQDTKSSNGTFINNQRLCKGGEESSPRECFSGDLIQFGVDVMENNRRGEKITHGCIIATITLFHPDGREAKPLYSNSSPFLNGPSPPGIAIQSQELYQLANYLQEALHREKMLEQKLSTLQQLVQQTQQSSESGWQALITEDRLISRLEVLQNQLHAYSKAHTEDTLRQELVALQEDKLNYETTAKESLRKVLQEKLDAVRKLSDLERSFSNSEEECTHLKEKCQKGQEEVEKLAKEYQDQLNEVQKLQEELQEAERKHEEESERIEKEKVELTEKLEEMMKQESSLSAQVESLQADNDFSKEQLAAMKAKLEDKKENKENEVNDSDTEIITTDSKIEIIPIKDLGPEELAVKLKETQQQIEVYKAKLEEGESKLKESNDKVEQLQKKMGVSDLHMNQVVENAMADLTLQLKESHKQSDSSNELIKALQGQITELENELALYKLPQSEKSESTVVGSSVIENQVVNGVINTSIADTTITKMESVQKLIDEAKEKQDKAEKELRHCKCEVDEVKGKLKKANDETTVLKSQVADTNLQLKEKSAIVIDLQDQLRKAETTTKEVKQQIIDLRDRLMDENGQNHYYAEVSSLRRKLDQESLKTKDLQKDFEETKRQLQEAQQSAKRSHNEAEQIRKLSSLKDECASLRKRIQAIEAEMKMSRKENLQLSSEYNKLQESYKELEALKEQLEIKQLTWRTNLTDAQKDAEQSKLELSQSSQDMVKLKEECELYHSEVTDLTGKLSELSDDYKLLADKSKFISLCSSVPLLMLLFAILMAFYPTLSQLTATTI